MQHLSSRRHKVAASLPPVAVVVAAFVAAALVVANEMPNRNPRPRSGPYNSVGKCHGSSSSSVTAHFPFSYFIAFSIPKHFFNILSAGSDYDVGDDE